MQCITSLMPSKIIQVGHKKRVALILALTLLTDLQNLSLPEITWNIQQNPRENSHLTQNVLMHYLNKVPNFANMNKCTDFGMQDG